MQCNGRVVDVFIVANAVRLLFSKGDRPSRPDVLHPRGRISCDGALIRRIYCPFSKFTILSGSVAVLFVVDFLRFRPFSSNSVTPASQGCS